MLSRYKLLGDLTGDAEYIDNCGIEFSIIDNRLFGENDSGWCDYATGQPLYPAPALSELSVIFNIYEPSELIHLKLRFPEDRLVEVSLY